MVNLSQNILTTDEQCSIRCVPPDTKTGLSVVVNVIDQIYETGRKVAKGFKETMKIIFDEYLPKWNYRAVPTI